jgi:hypothetical protein
MEYQVPTAQDVLRGKEDSVDFLNKRNWETLKMAIFWNMAHIYIFSSGLQTQQ